MKNEIVFDIEPGVTTSTEMLEQFAISPEWAYNWLDRIDKPNNLTLAEQWSVLEGLQLYHQCMLDKISSIATRKLVE